jgi:hypothetical protein
LPSMKRRGAACAALLALLTSPLRTACELRRNFSHRHGGTILSQEHSPLDFADPLATGR